MLKKLLKEIKDAWYLLSLALGINFICQGVLLAARLDTPWWGGWKEWVVNCIGIIFLQFSISGIIKKIKNNEE